MDASKIFTVLCAFLLVICLTLSITALVVMRNAISENEAWQSRAEVMVGKLDSILEGTSDRDLPVSAPTDKEDSSTDGDTPQRFCLRDVGGKIGVYTEDGYPVRVLDVPVKALPTSDQTALADGIWVNSGRELNELIRDYES